MGAINLASGNIITLGYDEDYYTSDEELREWAIEEFEAQEYLQELYTLEGYIKLKAQDDYDNWIWEQEREFYREIENVVEGTKPFTEWLTLRVEPGYYEGFSVVVDMGNWDYFDDYNEKELTMDDTKLIQSRLEELVDDYGLKVVYPHWCSTWLNHEESKKAIKKAMAELRRQIKAIPCYSRYRKVV